MQPIYVPYIYTNHQSLLFAKHSPWTDKILSQILQHNKNSFDANTFRTCHVKFIYFTSCISLLPKIPINHKNTEHCSTELKQMQNHIICSIT